MVMGVMARLTSAALLATTLTALPASASAAENGYTPEQVCGSSFGRVTDGTQPVTDQYGSVRGYVHLLYSARTGEYCVVTIKTSFVGRPTPTRAALVRKGFLGVTVPDEGDYKYYAGPVKMQAKGICVAFNGYIGDGGTTDVNSHAFGGSNGSGHCGGQDQLRRGIR